MTKIVLMGTPAFPIPILESLIEVGYDVQAAVTQPDRPVGRKKVITPTLVKKATLKHNLLVLQPKKIPGFLETGRVVSSAPDLVVTAAFGQSLPEKILKTPKLGAINVHASLSPEYRGGAPVHYSTIEGEKETGVAIMEMVRKMDAGAILPQHTISITKQDDIGTTFEKLSILGRELLLETSPRLITGEIAPISQMEKEITLSPNIIREQEQIDWQKTTEAIDNQVCDMCPWPAASTTYQGTNWKTWIVTPLTEMTTGAPGTITQCSKKALRTIRGEGTIPQIDCLQPAGKGQLTTQELSSGVGQNVTEEDKVD